MKLIRWVELHIGRSRRKHKKERDATPPTTPLRKVEPLGSTPRSTPGSTPHTPRLHIRTTLLEPGLSPMGRRAAAVDSPRVRCRIRTNPWLPSPKNVERWAAGSSIGSESSESISGFGSQSSGSLWEGDPWCRPPRRVTLEPRLRDEDEPALYCRPLPRSAWMNFKELLEKGEDGDSSDEAYSEDYAPQDDFSLDTRRSSKNSPPDTGSPQADSACGSDRDASSCSTTPVSETPASTTRKSLADSKEMLQDKVHRLQRERHLVDKRMQEARAEEMLRREEHLLLQRELVQFRRLFLIQTLSELRNQLERKHHDK